MHIDESAAPGCECLATLLKGKVPVHDCRVLCCYSGTLSFWRSILSLQGFKILFQRRISSQPTAHKNRFLHAICVVFSTKAVCMQKLTSQIEVESHTSQTPVGECSVSVLSENRPINLRKYSLIRRTNDFSMRKSFWGALSSLFQAFASVSLFRLIDSFLA